MDTAKYDSLPALLIVANLALKPIICESWICFRHVHLCSQFNLTLLRSVLTGQTRGVQSAFNETGQTQSQNIWPDIAQPASRSGRAIPQSTGSYQGMSILSLASGQLLNIRCPTSGGYRIDEDEEEEEGHAAGTPRANQVGSTQQGGYQSV